MNLIIRSARDMSSMSIFKFQVLAIHHFWLQANIVISLQAPLTIRVLLLPRLTCLPSSAKKFNSAPGIYSNPDYALRKIRKHDFCLDSGAYVSVSWILHLASSGSLQLRYKISIPFFYSLWCGLLCPESANRPSHFGWALIYRRRSVLFLQQEATLGLFDQK